jgi:hypothetical protein
VTVPFDLAVPEVPTAPTLVCGLESWIDAGNAARLARDTLGAGTTLDLVGRFDADELIDHQARRPIMHLVDGVNTGLTWPVLELHLGTDRGEHRFLHLTGAEPDHRWRDFAATVVALARRAGVEQVISLGAYPAPVPHTRPAKVVATATSQPLADRVGFIAGRLDAPAGISAAIERACADDGIDAVGLWAQVPHYVANLPYPGATLALLDKLAELSDISVDTAELVSAAAETRARLDTLIAANAEHAAMVRQLEQGFDEQATTVFPLPSRDELAAEVERFLRTQDD